MNFKLNETLEKDSFYITNLKLCELRLINNSDYPWFILVPMRNNIIEITDLSPEDFNLFNHETRKIATLVIEHFNPCKLNIATIGNVVNQLHMHIIARFKNDKLFPKTVWGSDFKPYNTHEAQSVINKLVGQVNSRL